jgi:hypothetical protein
VSENGQPLETPTPPAIVRRNHGRGHSYTINGEKMPGATTVLGDGYPKPAIARWAARTCAQEVLDFWDELGELLPSDRAERVRTAPDRDRDAAARRGTEVHRLAQRLQAGDEVEVPDELEGHVDAYLRFADEWQPRELFVEAPVANLSWRYSGTPDIVADLVDGSRWLLDLKTTRSGIFAEAALQLAAYRHAEWILDPATGVVVPMPAVDRAGAVWLKADRTYELVEVDAGPETFEMFLYVLEVAGFTKRDDVIGEPLKVPTA